MKILHRYTAAVLWESPCSTMAATLKKAIAEGADLSGANLSGANLSGADLRGANLRGANLSGADLSDADLRGANLYGANLSGANLRGANLSDTDLRGANLYGAKNYELAIARTRILPDGELIGWKKAYALGGDYKEVIVQLRIPATAKRSHAFGRKCRASEAVVIAIEGAESARSGHDRDFTYGVGDTLKPREAFDENWQEECASGIHFFITKLEAEGYSL